MDEKLTEILQLVRKLMDNQDSLDRAIKRNGRMWLSQDDAAKLLGVDRSYVRFLIKKGFINLNGKGKINKDELTKFANSEETIKRSIEEAEK